MKTKTINKGKKYLNSRINEAEPKIKIIKRKNEPKKWTEKKRTEKNETKKTYQMNAIRADITGNPILDSDNLRSNSILSS